MCIQKNLETVRGPLRVLGAGGSITKTQTNSEKRKEKSRDAARHRRGKESVIFSELAEVLPLTPQAVAQLDKASIMRLTLAFLKTRALCDKGLSKRRGLGGSGAKLELDRGEFFLNALDGFVLVVSADGDVVYTSDNIVTILGLSQMDVMGQSLYDYTSPCDHDEVRELVAVKSSPRARHAFLRFKCTLTAKGRSVNLKSATYKVVQVRGEMVGEHMEQTWLVALATPVPHPANIEFPLDKQTFVTKHSLDMKFTYVDVNVEKFCGYGTDELVGRSLYELHHALDSDLIKDAYKILRSKGQVETGRYRFLARTGGYVWVVTQATLIHGPKDNKPQCVVCLNYVLSGIECGGEILSEFQLMCSNSDRNSNNNDDSTSNNYNSCSDSNIHSDRPNNNCAPASVALPSPVPRGLPTPTCSPSPKADTVIPKAKADVPRITPAPPPRPPPVATTFKIFAPRTEDMNKGYLIFSDDDPHSAVLKEEPDDLTHLAPSGGDTCVRLLEVPNLVSDLAEDSCMPQEGSTLIPSFDDMLNLDYPMPFVNSDATIPSPSTEKVEDQDSSSRYLYEDSHQQEGVKCMNSLSGGRLLLSRSGCSTPSPDCSSLHPGGLGTPEPPKPLLTQAALSPLCKKQNPIPFGSSRPRTTTESFFMQLDESNTGGSSELFGKLDLKLEDQNMDSDELDMRAPFIPNSNELLLYLSPDDLLMGSEPELTISPKYLRDVKGPVTNDKEDSSLAHLLRDTDPHIAGGGSGRNIHVDHSPGAQRSQYQSKFLEGGGNFVDPNKVLPGHFAGKDELDNVGSTSHVVDLPLVLMPEPVEPPPPLLSVDTQQLSGPVKRGRSPLSSPTLLHKKMCSPPCQQRQQQSFQQQQQQSQSALGQQHPQQTGGLRLLTTPHAPTMQQLLVSKEPITVRGGRPAGGTSASRNLLTDKGHSVLRNLLVSGRDESAGYSVSAPGSPAGTPSGSCATSPGPHPPWEEAKGGKNINEENSIVVEEAQAGGVSSAPTAIPLPKDKMTTMLLTSSGGKTGAQFSYPTLRLVTGNHGTLKQAGHLAFKLTSNPSSQPGEVCSSRLGQRQDPFLLMRPDTTIPTLQDLTQQDYEVNAPANNCLQGAELLMALDQSLETVLLDGK